MSLKKSLRKQSKKIKEMQNEKKKKERNRELVQEGQHPNTGMGGRRGGLETGINGENVIK